MSYHLMLDITLSLALVAWASWKFCAVFLSRHDAITNAMIRNGWTDLWYANPCSKGEDPTAPRVGHCGPRWHAGIWTGPDGDMICVADAKTRADARRLESPDGWTPAEAVVNAEEKLRRLSE